MGVMGEVVVVAINLVKRIAILDDDTVFAITDMLDDDGDETEDPDEAVVAVGQLPDGRWVTFETEGFGEEGYPH